MRPRIDESGESSRPSADSSVRKRSLHPPASTCHPPRYLSLSAFSSAACGCPCRLCPRNRSCIRRRRSLSSRFLVLGEAANAVATSTHPTSVAGFGRVPLGGRRVPAGRTDPWGWPAAAEFAAQGRNAEGVRLFQQARYQEAVRAVPGGHLRRPEQCRRLLQPRRHLSSHRPARTPPGRPGSGRNLLQSMPGSECQPHRLLPRAGRAAGRAGAQRTRPFG